MKRLVLLACACIPAAAQGVDLAPAAQAYRAGEFERAHELFAATLRTPGVRRGDVLFHLGNCAWRLDRPAEALWHYRRALRELPRDPALQANVRLAEQRLGVEPPPATLGDGLLAPLRRLTAGELLVLASALQAAGLVGFLLCRRRVPRLLFAVLVLAGIAAGADVVRRQWIARPAAAVVLAGSPLRAEPSAGAAVVLQLRPGETLATGSVHDGWVEVTHALATGFVELRTLGLVD